MDTVSYSTEEKIRLLRANGYVVRKEKVTGFSKESLAFKAGRKYNIDPAFDSTVKNILLMMNPGGEGGEEEEEQGFYSAGVGIDITGSVISLSHLGIENLTDPGADKIMVWDNASGAVGWDEITLTSKIKVSSNDTTPGYLEDKLVLSYGGNVSQMIEISTILEGANEKRVLQVDETKISHDNIADVSANDHHNQAHVLTGTDHTASGLTTGYVIRATGATTFAWQQLQHNDLGGVTANLHHNEAHILGTSGPHTESLPLADLAPGTAGDIITRQASDWAVLAKGTENYILKMGATYPAWGTVDWSELTGTQPAPIAHNHAWSDITSGVPTTFGGYGISDTLANLNTALSDATLYQWEADQGATNIHGDNVVYGSAASTACVGNDARLSNARTPTQHAMDSATYHTSSDITVLNATTSKHGFLRKLGGGTTNYLRADGTWAAPSGTGPAARMNWTNGGSNRIGTYVDADTINAEANLTFNGTDLTVTGDIHANYGEFGVSQDADGVYVKSINTNTGTSAAARIKIQSYNNDLQFVSYGENHSVYPTQNHMYTAYVGGKINIGSFGNNGMVFTDGGSIELYHNDLKKFETTTTGVTVTGVITATGGNSTEWNTAYDHSTDNSQAHSDYMLNTGDTASGTYNFDNDTLVVNSTTHRVGIGTATPQEKFHVSGSGAAIRMEVEATDGNTAHYKLTNSEGSFSMYTDADKYHIRDITDGADRLTIDGDGKIGINRTDPSYQLDVNGTGRFTGDLGVTNDASVGRWLYVADKIGVGGLYSADYTFKAWGSTAAKYVGLFTQTNVAGHGLRVDVDGTSSTILGLGIYSVTTKVAEIRADGDMWASNYLLSSDIILKKNIVTVRDGLNIALGLRPVHFDWKDGRDSFDHIGFIAQDLERIRPELVKDGEHKSVSYSTITAINNAAIHALNTKVETNEEKIIRLEKRVKELENEGS